MNCGQCKHFKKRWRDVGECTIVLPYPLPGWLTAEIDSNEDSLRKVSSSEYGIDNYANDCEAFSPRDDGE